MSNEGQAALEKFLAGGGKVTLCPSAGTGPVTHYDNVVRARLAVYFSLKNKALAIKATQSRVLTRRKKDAERDNIAAMA